MSPPPDLDIEDTPFDRFLDLLAAEPELIYVRNLWALVCFKLFFRYKHDMDTKWSWMGDWVVGREEGGWAYKFDTFHFVGGV